MPGMVALLEFTGNLGLFAGRAARRAFVPPFECEMIWRQIGEVGWKSLPLVLSSGFAVGLVLTLHTRSTMIRFGAESLIPAVQSLAFFNEIGPLVAGLLVAGRVGAGQETALSDEQRRQRFLILLGIDRRKFTLSLRDERDGIEAVIVVARRIAVDESDAGLRGKRRDGSRELLPDCGSAPGAERVRRRVYLDAINQNVDGAGDAFRAARIDDVAHPES